MLGMLARSRRSEQRERPEQIVLDDDPGGPSNVPVYSYAGEAPRRSAFSFFRGSQSRTEAEAAAAARAQAAQQEGVRRFLRIPGRSQAVRESAEEQDEGGPHSPTVIDERPPEERRPQRLRKTGRRFAIDEDKTPVREYPPFEIGSQGEVQERRASGSTRGEPSPRIQFAGHLEDVRQQAYDTNMQEHAPPAAETSSRKSGSRNSRANPSPRTQGSGHLQDVRQQAYAQEMRAGPSSRRASSQAQPSPRTHFSGRLEDVRQQAYDANMAEHPHVAAETASRKSGSRASRGHPSPQTHFIGHLEEVRQDAYDANMAEHAAVAPNTPSSRKTGSRTSRVQHSPRTLFASPLEDVQQQPYAQEMQAGPSGTYSHAEYYAPVVEVPQGHGQERPEGATPSATDPSSRRSGSKLVRRQRRRGPQEAAPEPEIRREELPPMTMAERELPRRQTNRLRRRTISNRSRGGEPIIAAVPMAEEGPPVSGRRTSDVPFPLHMVPVSRTTKLHEDFSSIAPSEARSAAHSGRSTRPNRIRLTDQPPRINTEAREEPDGPREEPPAHESEAPAEGVRRTRTSRIRFLPAFGGRALEQREQATPSEGTREEDAESPKPMRGILQRFGLNRRNTMPEHPLSESPTQEEHEEGPQSPISERGAEEGTPTRSRRTTFMSRLVRRPGTPRGEEERSEALGSPTFERREEEVQPQGSRGRKSSLLSRMMGRKEDEPEEEGGEPERVASPASERKEGEQSTGGRKSSLLSRFTSTRRKEEDQNEDRPESRQEDTRGTRGRKSSLLSRFTRQNKAEHEQAEQQHEQHEPSEEGGPHEEGGEGHEHEHEEHYEEGASEHPGVVEGEDGVRRLAAIPSEHSGSRPVSAAILSRAASSQRGGHAEGSQSGAPVQLVMDPIRGTTPTHIRATRAGQPTKQIAVFDGLVELQIPEDADVDLGTVENGVARFDPMPEGWKVDAIITFPRGLQIS